MMWVLPLAPCGLSRLRIARDSQIGDFRSAGSHRFLLQSLLISQGFSARSARMSSAGTGDAASVKSVSVRIRGKVQGVFYRNWTVDTAKQLGVNGWVRNNVDGTVEAVFSGQASAVDTLIEKCKSGPPAAKVSNVEVVGYKDTVPDGFERKPTLW